jgi:hypothetical protein
MKFENKRSIGIVAAVVMLLLIPAAAMTFTNEVNWSPIDFVVAGVLLLGTGLACELVLRLVTKPLYRLALCGAILFALFIVWAELAVGLIDTRFAGS